jgi:serine/threonine protein kinase
MEGRVIDGKYRVDHLLGEGGMGMVYKATQISLNKTIVLKVLRPSLMSDERTVARFQREARAASRLNHPNSIAVIDFGQAADDGSMYIAMEYCPGHDLHHLLSTEWPIEESRIIRIGSQVLSALAEAHANSVIHRDLKPENIMVEQRRGEPDFVKVLDFGIAKIMDSTGEDGAVLTRNGFVCGTPEYMSPEQAKGAPVDARSDIYAVGVILYQMVTGLLPFDSESAVGFATAHLTQEPPPPRKRRPDCRVSPGLERLIMRSLIKDPAGRPQSCDDFREELLALAVNAPRLSSPSLKALAAYRDVPEDTTTSTTTKPQRPERPEKVAVAPRGRSEPTDVSQSGDSTKRISTQPEARVPRVHGTPQGPKIALGVGAVALLGAAAFYWFTTHSGPEPLVLDDKPAISPIVPKEPPKATPLPRPPEREESLTNNKDDDSILNTNVDEAKSLAKLASAKDMVKKSDPKLALEEAKASVRENNTNLAAVRFLKGLCNQFASLRCSTNLWRQIDRLEKQPAKD